MIHIRVSQTFVFAGLYASDICRLLLKSLYVTLYLFHTQQDKKDASTNQYNFCFC